MIARNGTTYGALDLNSGPSQADILTMSLNLSNPVLPSGSQATPPLQVAKSSTPIWITFVAILVILIAIKFASEHEKAGMDPTFMGVGVYNLVTVTLMAILGISVTKIIVNKYHVKGLTDIVNLV